MLTSLHILWIIKLFILIFYLWLADINNTIIKNDKSIDKEENNTNMMSMKNTNEQIEKKIENKSKYPRNERVRVRKYNIMFFNRENI